MYPDPTTLVQTRMSDLRREADRERRVQRIKAPKPAAGRPVRRPLLPAFLTFTRVRHA
ncbi:hypothetical protein [Nocardioides marmoribigeumensis]|uniref:Uncharacterized protein n=1 Tax=Nocardioides marmoribigeumensis TaxID=433649 RepID=A0ABU2C1W9_9ACTN|nr:hypothetical protein [Nocardioides marmoribigeumensis]MDR7364645.1 hypothetical protein [Nocardioides marmoribigeumensis]